MRAQAAAVFAAHSLQGNGQEHLLPQHIFQQHAFPGVVADLGLVFWNGALIHSRIGAAGTVKQVEIPGNVAGYWFQAAGAIQLQAGGEMAYYPDILNALPVSPAFFYQFRVAARAQRPHLVNIFSVINNIRPDLFLEIDPVLL